MSISILVFAFWTDSVVTRYSVQRFVDLYQLLYKFEFHRQLTDADLQEPRGGAQHPRDRQVLHEVDAEADGGAARAVRERDGGLPLHDGGEGRRGGEDRQTRR